jgi:hypothetical protein
MILIGPRIISQKKLKYFCLSAVAEDEAPMKVWRMCE